MRRVMIGSILIGIGYLLAFAGISEGGKYALNPWGALKAAA